MTVRKGRRSGAARPGPAWAGGRAPGAGSPRGRWLAATACAWAAAELFARGACWPALIAVAGGWAAFHLGGTASPIPPAARGWRAPLWGAAAVFAAALAVRLWRLNAFPPLWWDEAVEAYDVRCLLNGLPLEPLTGIEYHRGPAWLALLAVVGKLAGPSVLAWRATAAVAGAAACGLTCAVGWRLFGPATGLLAGAWMACHPWSLHVSRFMMGNVLVPAGGAAVVLAALRGSRLVRAAVAGAVAGVSVFGYAAALHLPLVASAAVWWFPPWPASIRRRALAASVALAVSAACVLAAAVGFPGFLHKSASLSLLTRPAVVLGNARRTALMFLRQGDEDMRHQYPAGAPVFSRLTGPCFVLGTIVSLGPAAPAGAGFLPVWAALALAPGVVSDGGAANEFRMVGAPPALGLLAATGAVTVARSFGARLGAGLVAVCWAVSAAGDLRVYFRDYPADRMTGSWYRTFDREAADRLRALAAARPLALCWPLHLSQHPVEKFLLFDELRAGRVRPADRPCRDLAPCEVYRDPFGLPQAVLLVEGGCPDGKAPRGSGPLRVEYRTLLELGRTGDGLMLGGRVRESLEHYRRAVRWLPDSPHLRERLGYAALRAGNLAEAERAFRRAVDLGARLASTWDGLAAALFRQGRYAEAEKAVDEALRLAPLDPEIQADLARIRAVRTDRSARTDRSIRTDRSARTGRAARSGHRPASMEP